MYQGIDDKRQARKDELIRKFNEAARYLLTGITLTFLLFEIYIICKTLIQFLVMCENWIRLYILNYIIN